MIDTSTLTAIGRVTKTHGIAGEMSAEVYRPEVASPRTVPVLFFCLEGIQVPFFVRDSRPRGSHGCLFSLDGVNSDTEAAPFVGMEFYAEEKYLDHSQEDDDEDYLTLDDLIGYTLCDMDAQHPVGVIAGVDDSTDNVLFEVDTPQGAQVLVPAATELVLDVDPDTQTLVMNIPQGLI